MTNLIWNLESIFAGGSQSQELTTFLDNLNERLTEAEEKGLPGNLSEANQTAWVEIIQNYYDLGAHLKQASSFVGCLVSQDTTDEAARLLDSKMDGISARLGTLFSHLGSALAAQADDDWEHLLQLTELQSIAFALNEQRSLAREKMEPELEAIAGELAANGYHAWGQLYNTISGFKHMPFEENGETKKLSLGQLQSKFMTDTNRTVRQQAFETYQLAWQELAQVLSMTLNNQAGYRLTLYRHRGWDSVLKEPLFMNRLKSKTLDTMWEVIADKSVKLLDYFAAKAKLIGVDKLSWYDVSAPVGNLTRTFTFEEAGNFVVENLEKVNPSIAEYSRMAVDKQWVEAEDRAGKRMGAFCTSFPLIGESRIFMTFNGSYGNLSTLAHELGHGYHGWVMRDLPYGARRYTMSVAETASTFNELIVTDASLKAAQDDMERLGLLSQKLDDAATFMMNIRARFEFEKAFFAQRAKGPLSVDALCSLMLETQQNTYHHGLAEDGYFPLFWASKLHFHITQVPFYNFPYTFGYLFSHGVYKMAMAEGKAFGDRYIALLRDTGSMDTETLAQTHLGVDLTKADFWSVAIDSILEEVDEFVVLANKLN